MALAIDVLTNRELRGLGLVRLAEIGRSFNLDSDAVWKKIQALPDVKEVLPSREFKRDDLHVWNKILDTPGGRNLVRQEFLSLVGGGEVKITKPER